MRNLTIMRVMPRRARSRRSLDCRLEPLESRRLLSTILVVTTNDSGPGSLRQAILDANALPDGDRIEFQIESEPDFVNRISPLTPLPPITGPVVLDGYTQSGSSTNTSSSGSNATLRIELSGENADSKWIGLLVQSSGVVIRGLAINGWREGVGVAFESGAGSQLAGCFMGTDATGSTAVPNGVGVSIASGSSQLGGTALADRNVIAGNLREGIVVGQGSIASTIFGNQIGLGATSAVLANGGSGIWLDGAIGTRLGGTVAGAANVIAHNGGAGVMVTGAAAGNAILSNSIFQNGRLGIDLGNDGVTANDPFDSDTGPNGLQNYPFFSAVSTSGATIAVEGTLTSAANSTFLLQFFSTGGSADSSGYGQGAVLLSGVFVHTNASGNASFSTSFPGTIPDGHALTATATDSQGNTSEFSAVIAPTTDIGVQVSADRDSVYTNEVITYTTVVANHGPSVVSLVSVRNTLPQGVTIVSVDGGTYSWAMQGNSVVTTLVDLAIGQSVSLVIVARPTSSAASSITHPVTAFGSRPDPVASNNTSSVTTNVIRIADLALTAQPATPNPAMSNRPLTFLFQVTNHGPNQATLVSLAGTLPEHATFVSATASQGSASVEDTQLTAALGTLNAGQSATLAIVVIPSTDAIGTSLQFSAMVHADQTDLDSINNAADASVPVILAADLDVAVDSSAGPVLFGSTFTHTITARNLGPNDASGSTLTYEIPAGVELVNVQFSDPSRTPTVAPGLIVLDLGPFVSGSVETLAVTMRPTAPGSYTAKVSMRSELFDPNASNDSVTITTDVVPSADLQVTISTLTAKPLVGQPVEFLVTVSNGGPNVALATALALELPNMIVTAAVPSAGTAALDGSHVGVDIGNIAKGEIVSIQVTATPSGDGTIEALATAHSDTAERVPADNVATRSVVVQPHSDLELQIATVPQTGMPEGKIALGQVLTYKVKVTNLGPSIATGVVVADSLPASAGFLSLSLPADSVDQSGQLLTLRLGSLAVGQSIEATISVSPGVLGSIVNVASAHSDNADLVASNSTSISVTTEVGRAGVFQFDVTTYEVAEAAGFVTITLTRTEGTLGTVRVRYAMAGGDGTLGQDYKLGSGIVEFLDGEESQSFVVQIIDDNISESNETILIALSDPSSGASLGPEKFVVITILDDDIPPPPPVPVPDTRAPKVSFLERTGTARQPTRLIIHFDEPLNRASATDLRNYRLISPGRDRKLGTKDDTTVPIYPPLYDPATNAVLLRTFLPLSTNTVYMLKSSGSTAFAIKDLAGNRLDGNRDGAPGGDFVALVNKSLIQPPGSGGSIKGKSAAVVAAANAPVPQGPRPRPKRAKRA